MLASHLCRSKTARSALTSLDPSLKLNFLATGFGIMPRLLLAWSGTIINIVVVCYT